MLSDRSNSIESTGVAIHSIREAIRSVATCTHHKQHHSIMSSSDRSHSIESIRVAIHSMREAIRSVATCTHHTRSALKCQSLHLSFRLSSVDMSHSSGLVCRLVCGLVCGVVWSAVHTHRISLHFSFRLPLHFFFRLSSVDMSHSSGVCVV